MELNSASPVGGKNGWTWEINDYREISDMAVIMQELYGFRKDNKQRENTKWI